MGPVEMKTERASIEQCIKNGKRMRWSMYKIVGSLRKLGFTDKEIRKATEARRNV